jgi:small subunit ribosomal protein S1
MVGVLERSDVEYDRTGNDVRDIAVITRVGKAVCFKVMGFFYDNGVKVARLSRKEAQRECYNVFLDNCIAGDVIDAKVTHLESFGAFVDVGCGIVSLLSIDCISVSRISHPSDRLSVGMGIWAAVKSIDRDLGRIFLTQKELLGTWEENAAEFEVGQTAAGTIRSIESYGIFIELTPNLAGLAELRPEDDRDSLLPLIGKSCAVYIKSIIPERMKIKLVLVDTYNGEVRKAPPKYFVDFSKKSHIDYWR